MVFGITITVILAVATLAAILWLTSMRTQYLKEQSLWQEAASGLAQTIRHCLDNCSQTLIQSENAPEIYQNQITNIREKFEIALEHLGSDAFLTYVELAKVELKQMVSSEKASAQMNAETLADLNAHLNQLELSFAYFQSTHLHFNQISQRFPYSWLKRFK